MENRTAGLCLNLAVVMGVLSALVSILCLIVISFLMALTVLVSGFFSCLTLYVYHKILILQEENYSATLNTQDILRLMQKQLAQLSAPAVPDEETAPPLTQATSAAPNEPAHFNRSQLSDQLVCPVCKTQQNSNRKMCFNCGTKFVFDEQPPVT